MHHIGGGGVHPQIKSLNTSILQQQQKNLFNHPNLLASLISNFSKPTKCYKEGKYWKQTIPPKKIPKHNRVPDKKYQYFLMLFFQNVLIVFLFLSAIKEQPLSRYGHIWRRTFRSFMNFTDHKLSTLVSNCFNFISL